MSDNYKETISLTEDTLESRYSGLSDLLEVKDPMAWITGSKNRGEFRSMILDDVIPERKEIPEWAKTIDYVSSEKKFIKNTKIASAGIVGGEDTQLNTVGEAFYKLKDGFVDMFTSMPRDITRYGAATVKAAGFSPETTTEILDALNELEKDVDAERELRNFSLGIDEEKITNQFATVIGNMLGIVATGGATAATFGTKAGAVVGAAIEGAQEGGEYLKTDIAAQSQRKGGLEQYKGEGLGFATTLGILSGILGKKGVEAGFIENVGKFSKQQFKEEIKSEMATEGLQNLLGLVSRETQNKLYGTNTDQKTPVEGLLDTAKSMVLAAAGSATVGGIALVNNRNYLTQMLEENFGLTKADAKLLAKQYMETSADAVARNGLAMTDLSPNSRVMQFAKEQLIRDGQTEEQADKTLARIRRDIINEQVKKGEELSKNDFFEQSKTTEGLVEYLRQRTGVHALEDTVIAEEKQNIADRRAELEAQQVQTETPVEETTQEQPAVEEKKHEKQKFDYKKYISDEELQDARNQVIQKLTDNGINATAKNDISQDGAVYITIPDKGTVRIGITEITKGHPDNVIANFDAKSMSVDEIVAKIQELSAQENLPNQNTRLKGGVLANVNNGEFVDWRAEQASKTPTPVQLELNFLNAEENAINQTMGIETPVLPVDNNLLTKKDMEAINNKIDEINEKLDSIPKQATPEQKTEYEVGKELNSFQKPKTAKSAYSVRVAEQTKTEGISPLLHNVRDTKAAKTAADTLVETDENSAWGMLENDRADTRGFLRAEVAEALKRKIAKIQDPEVRKAQLRRLINAYANVATRAGQELRALADDSLVDAIRDAAQIEAQAVRKIKKEVKNKSAKVQKTVDKVVKSNKVMSDKKLWDLIKEQMECK